MYGKKLAYGVKIKEIREIPGADRIELATVMDKSTEIAYKWLVETVKEYFPLVAFIGLILTSVFIGLSRI